MKYYSKTPEELKEFLEKSQKKMINPFRNRTFLMIFADLLIVFAVIGTLKHFGFLEHDTISVKHPVFRNYIEFSGTIVGLRKKNTPPTFYLILKSKDSKVRTFPATTEGSKLKGVELEIFSEGARIASIPLPIAPRQIKPFETINYRFEPELDKKIQEIRHLCVYRFILTFEDGEVVLNFPGADKLPARNGN